MSVAQRNAVKLRGMRSVADYGVVGDGVTSDQTAAAAAVAAAYASGDDLYWPDGTYLTTASIPNFHSVKHSGPGVIKRGTDLYKITPVGTQTNIIYVATTGSDANDGLSSSQPVATVAGAMSVLKSPTIIEGMADGIWRVQFAAGTWTDGGDFSKYAAAANYVEFVGTVDGSGVPTTIIDGTTSTKTAGLYFDSGPSLIKVQDIKCQNFRANSVASGIVFANKGIAKCWTYNVHSYNNLWAGVNVDSVGQYLVTGGTHDANTNYNLRVRGGVACGIGLDATRRTTLKNNVTAVQIRDSCSGHFDNVDIINDPTTATGTGLWVTNNSRTVLNNCTLTNCAVGILCGNGSTFGQVSVTMTNVPTQFRTEENGTQDRDAGTGGGEGLCYDKFFNRYSTGLGAYGGNPFSSTAHAWATDKTGTADFSYLVPTATTARFLVGNTSNNAYFRQDWDITNTRITWVLNNTSVFRIASTGINPATDSTFTVGTASARWSDVYAVSGAINTSDAREKQQIRSISEKEKAVALKLKANLCAFKFNDAVAAKGDGARIHVGTVAQEVVAAFASEGLDATKYAMLCYDEWPADGDNPAGNRYGVRYEELLSFIVAAI